MLECKWLVNANIQYLDAIPFTNGSVVFEISKKMRDQQLRVHPGRHDATGFANCDPHKVRQVGMIRT
jgi:hypothetical protein